MFRPRHGRPLVRMGTPSRFSQLVWVVVEPYAPGIPPLPVVLVFLAAA
ncbi:MAG TPA: hypothetical protein VKR06_22655 [Ktedonosporobacter sp.]|nr:hypothetical protein [Ktedonosporobacter sp.]